MKVFLHIPLLIVLSVAALIYGCVFHGFGGASESFERTVELSEEISQGQQFSAQTSNGAITVTGSDRPQCQVTATFNGRAGTLERAREIAEQTQIRLQRNADGLKAVIDRPTMNRPESVSVSYDIHIPGQTALDLHTSNGKITVAHIKDAIRTRTSNGKIHITDAAGAIDANTSNGSIVILQSPAKSLNLHTSNGAIKCEDITGPLTASTSNGSVTVRYAAGADPATDIHITTSNGSIDLKTPEHYSAAVDAATSNGKIRIAIPITVQGEIGKTLKGVINDGKATLTLRTSNSSIIIQ